MLVVNIQKKSFHKQLQSFSNISNVCDCVKDQVKQVKVCSLLQLLFAASASLVGVGEVSVS